MLGNGNNSSCPSSHRFFACMQVWRLCHYMGDRHTNNQAEYAGLIAGLHAALALGCTRVTVLGDSTLIIRQVGSRQGLAPAAVLPWYCRTCGGTTWGTVTRLACRRA